MKKLGYIGKSFTLGCVGILGTIIAACGGGGVTGVVAATATPSENVLFAMAYQPHPNSADDLKWKTAQGGDVYAGSGGTWSYGDWGTWTQADIDAKGWVGVQFKHEAALADGSYLYYKVQAPQNASVDVSATDTLLIKMGNEKFGSQANTPMQVTVGLKGGTYDTNTYSYQYSCTAKQTLRETTLVSTYAIALSGLTCGNDGDFDNLKTDVKAVTLEVLPGDGNATTDAATADTYTLIQLDSIAFSKSYF